MTCANPMTCASPAGGGKVRGQGALIGWADPPPSTYCCVSFWVRPSVDCTSQTALISLVLAPLRARPKPGPHRTRQRCSGPVCDRPSASRPVSFRQNRLSSGAWRRWRRFCKQSRNIADECGEDRASDGSCLAGRQEFGLGPANSSRRSSLD